MRKYYFLLFVFCVSTTLFSQKKGAIKDANFLFETKSYVKAAELYEEIIKSKQSMELLQNLGDCYFYNFQMPNAVRYYDLLFSTYKDSVKKEVYFRYANALKGTKNFEKGDQVMSQFVGYEQNTVKFIKQVTRAIPNSYSLKIMSSKTQNGDFGISFFGDKISFASSGNTANKSYGWNDKPYLDLFFASIDSNGQLDEIEPFPKTINTNKHESNATFNADGTIMFFNRSGEKQVKVGSENVATIKIYRAEFKNGQWTNVTMVPFSSNTYSVEHPHLTKDGKKLYFSSDMPGSIGSFDLYVVNINDDGTYGEPINLGNTINTNQREQFPFMSQDGSLYFASDGHQGIGNLDLFLSLRKSETEFEKPQNLGSTINSEMDDFIFILNEKNGKGYFASNRTGDDNLYTFELIENKIKDMIEGEVRDKKTTNLLPGAVVKLYDDKDIFLEEVTVGEDGVFSFYTKLGKKYKIKAFKDLYIPAEAEFDTNKKGIIYFDLQLKVESYDDAEKIIDKKEDGSVLIELKNIYFEYGKAELTSQAIEVLNVLLELLKKYPQMEIEIGAHTDTRASSLFNLSLSNFRAGMTLDYLVKNGIDKKRLRSIGYGESQPLVACEEDKCTETEHATNRRCTFKILK